MAKSGAARRKPAAEGEAELNELPGRAVGGAQALDRLIHERMRGQRAAYIQLFE